VGEAVSPWWTVSSLELNCQVSELGIEFGLTLGSATILPTIVCLKDQASHSFNVVCLSVETLEGGVLRGPLHPNDVGVPGMLQPSVAHLADVTVDFAGEVGHWVVPFGMNII